MNRKKQWMVAWTMLMATAMPLTPQDGASGNFWPDGDVIFELVGQVNNIPMTPTSLQFGYLSSIKGLEGIFSTSTPTAQNQNTAFFTFFNDS